MKIDQDEHFKQLGYKIRSAQQDLDFARAEQISYAKKWYDQNPMPVLDRLEGMLRHGLLIGKEDWVHQPRKVISCPQGYTYEDVHELAEISSTGSIQDARWLFCGIQEYFGQGQEVSILDLMDGFRAIDKAVDEGTVYSKFRHGAGPPPDWGHPDKVILPYYGEMVFVYIPLTREYWEMWLQDLIDGNVGSYVHSW